MPRLLNQYIERYIEWSDTPRDNTSITYICQKTQGQCDNSTMN